MVRADAAVTPVPLPAQRRAGDTGGRRPGQARTIIHRACLASPARLIGSANRPDHCHREKEPDRPTGRDRRGFSTPGKGAVEQKARAHERLQRHRQAVAAGGGGRPSSECAAPRPLQPLPTSGAGGEVEQTLVPSRRPGAAGNPRSISLLALPPAASPYCLPSALPRACRPKAQDGEAGAGRGGATGRGERGTDGLDSRGEAAARLHGPSPEEVCARCWQPVPALVRPPWRPPCRISLCPSQGLDVLARRKREEQGIAEPGEVGGFGLPPRARFLCPSPLCAHLLTEPCSVPMQTPSDPAWP